MGKHFPPLCIHPTAGGQTWPVNSWPDGVMNERLLFSVMMWAGGYDYIWSPVAPHQVCCRSIPLGLASAAIKSFFWTSSSSWAQLSNGLEKKKQNLFFISNSKCSHDSYSCLHSRWCTKARFGTFICRFPKLMRLFTKPHWHQNAQKWSRFHWCHFPPSVLNHELANR